MTEPFTRLAAALADRYRLEHELGFGGMATVYRAHDLRHDRPVAVKVLHADLAETIGSDRFHAEIKVTARLHHPHILQLHDSGEADGFLFYVMPLVEGESLRDRLARDRRLKLDDALRVAREVADALSYAHAQGVVHRDIKPENIMLASGHALVADFGIAFKVSTPADSRLTQAGLALGTAAYMSPEQATASPESDSRSDIYSLGCVLFEMLAGEAPFTGATAMAVIARRFAAPAPSVRTKVASVPEHVDVAIRRAMEREAADRYSTAALFAAALSAVGVETPPDDQVKRTIAVLPFANMSADPDTDFFSDGISEEILNAFVRVRGLRVIARTSSFAFKGKDVDARQIGERLGAGLLLEGSVRRAGSRLRVTAQLIEAATGIHLWSERYDREMTDVFAIQDEITATIRDALSAKLLQIGQVTVPLGRSIDPETYELFLRGRYFLHRPPEGLGKGVDLLRQAAERAPQHAPALVALAGAYSLLANYGMVDNYETRPKVRDLANRTLAIDPESGRAHRELAQVALYFDYDWIAARGHFERALALAPDDPLISSISTLFHSSAGEHRTAMRVAQHAVSLDPLNPLIRSMDVWAHYFARSWDEVIARSERMAEFDPHYSEAYRLRSTALVELGRLPEALRAAEQSVELSGRHPYHLAGLGRALAKSGQKDQARVVLEEMLARPQRDDLPIGVVHLALGDTDAFFAHIERYHGIRGHWMTMLRAEPLFDDARSDPRFVELVQRVGIPEWASAPAATNNHSAASR